MFPLQTSDFLQRGKLSGSALKKKLASFFRVPKEAGVRLSSAVSRWSSDRHGKPISGPNHSVVLTQLKDRQGRDSVTDLELPSGVERTT